MCTHVKADFRAALKQARRRKSQVFLELFAGVGEVWSAWRREGFGAVRFELGFGDCYDLTRPALIKLIEGWLSSHCVIGIQLGTPCTTWSMARRGPPGSAWAQIRNRRNLDGIPGIPERDQQKLVIGNKTAAVTGPLIRRCSKLGISCALQNPHSSLLWLSRYIAPLLNHKNYVEHVTYMCQHGARWRKRTRVGSWNCVPSARDLLTHERAPHHS